MENGIEKKIEELNYLGKRLELLVLEIMVQIAKILKGFGANILSYDKYLESYLYQSSIKIYENADIVSLHVPLTKETKYLVDKIFIEKFKKNFSNKYLKKVRKYQRSY